MKHIIYLTLLILASCGPEAEMFQRQYVIENSTSVPIELQFYRDGELNFGFATIRLEDEERLEGLILDRSGGPWSDLPPEQLSTLPRNSFEADSIRVIFNNQKQSIYTSNNSPNGAVFMPSNRNLLNDRDYSPIEGDKFLFTISESDLENAEDCNGNCE